MPTSSVCFQYAKWEAWSHLCFFLLQSPNHGCGQMGNFKGCTTFNKSLGQTVLSAWKCPKTQFWGPLTNWKFEPSPRPHTHSDPIINKHTKQVKKLCMDLSWHALNSMLEVKTLYHTEKQGFGYPGFQKNSRHTHQNPLKSNPVSERSAYPLQNYICFYLLTSGLESLTTNLLPLTDLGLRPTIQILASTKMGGA